MVQITEEQGEVKINWRVTECSQHVCCASEQVFQPCFCQQNVHVSLDFEHWEEPEGERPFTVGKG